jgi:hypothetical protein
MIGNGTVNADLPPAPEKPAFQEAHTAFDSTPVVEMLPKLSSSPPVEPEANQQVEQAANKIKSIPVWPDKPWYFINSDPDVSDSE